MKHLFFPVFLSFMLFFTPSLKAEGDVVQLQCQLKYCQGALYLYTFNGFGFEEVAMATAQEDGSYEFEVPKSMPRFYYVGTQKDKAKPIILGSEKTVKIKGNCTSIRSAQVSESPLNRNYTLLRGQLSQMTRATNTQVRTLSKAIRSKDDAGAETAIAALKKLDTQKKSFLDSIRQKDRFLYAIAGLNTMFSYHNNQGNYKNEIEYFGNEFFSHVDLSSAEMEGNSMIFEAFRNYTNVITNSVKLPANVHMAFIKNNLARTGENESTYKLALGGVLSVLEPKFHDNYKPLVQEFIQKYKNTDPDLCAELENKMKSMKGITIGGEAPDFSQATPDGSEMKLSELRGKVVLVDFWASWCGPCRRENPNVVRLYNQYKDKGFEILGVSLDRDKTRWLKAIEADQLTWHHVSDLKGWSNAVAKMYRVKSIPHTILLDAEGKVMARNLRGETLAKKLEELFGDKVEGSGK